MFSDNNWLTNENFGCVLTQLYQQTANLPLPLLLLLPVDVFFLNTIFCSLFTAGGGGGTEGGGGGGGGMELFTNASGWMVGGEACVRMTAVDL